MNTSEYLGMKGYGANQIMMNGQFMMIVHKDGKQILRISAPPNAPITEQMLFDVIKSQIEIYEEELKNGEEEKARTNND